jgi:glucosamine-6-phosphate deaminase
MPEVADRPIYKFDNAVARIFPSPKDLGIAAAEAAASEIQRAIERRGSARILVATGNSQIDLVDSLAKHKDVSWKHVEVFHMDEYVGIEPQHPSSFHYWIQSRVESKIPVAKVNYINGKAKDLQVEIDRYASLLMAGPIDVGFVGFGENGHIAFNEPPIADFNDPAVARVVALDKASRLQQVREGHFKDVDSVPKLAITLTCSALFFSKTWICSVPELRKAEAVRGALEGPISTACPASLVRRHPSAFVFLDNDSASLLNLRNGH